MPLRWIFVDLNSYFASVEQQDCPQYRGKPTVVAPVDTDFTSAIAASYEAKAFGIKTGTGIGEARRLCPDVQIVLARPELYVEMHHKIVAAVESCLHVNQVHSIDEVSCKLLGDERKPDNALELAKKVKKTILREAGECMRSSVGIAPNRFLAKVATDMQKPDGLITINESDLPEILYPLKLTDLPGIGSRMYKRLLSHGVGTVRQLCQLSEKDLRSAWNGVLGTTWWHWLRGYDTYEKPTVRRTLGHSHVLPPIMRSDDGAREVLVRLIHKAAARLRDIGYWAGKMSVHISYAYKAGHWYCDVPLGSCQDTLTMVEGLSGAWRDRPRPVGTPIKVAVTLYNLVAHQQAAIPLFAEERHRVDLSKAMDQVNAKFGKNKVYLGAMYNARDMARTGIAFNSVPDYKPQYS